MKRFVLLFVSVVVAAILLPATSGANLPTPTAEAASLEQALQSSSATTSAGAHSSRWKRWKRPKKMTSGKARQQAIKSSRLIYLSPEFTFDDYGASRCYRSSRTKVRCYTWVSEDFYDEYGYYDDTMLCDWFTTSYWTRSGRLGTWESSPECVWLSEV